MNKILRNIIGFIILIISSSGAIASSTANFFVNATILSTCTVLPATLAFGTYSPASNNDATTNISVTCTFGTGYHLKLDKGLNGSSTLARQMKGIVNTTSLLNYALFSDTGRTANWGNGATDTVPGVGTGVAQLVPVYGRISSGQTTLPADTYSDIVGISVTIP